MRRCRGSNRLICSGFLSSVVDRVAKINFGEELGTFEMALKCNADFCRYLKTNTSLQRSMWLIFAIVRIKML